MITELCEFRVLTLRGMRVHATCSLFVHLTVVSQNGTQVTFLINGDCGLGKNEAEGFSIVSAEEFCVAAVLNVLFVLFGD